MTKPYGMTYSEFTYDMISPTNTESPWRKKHGYQEDLSFFDTVFGCCLGASGGGGHSI
jgi:hypothetical protein